MIIQIVLFLFWNIGLQINHRMTIINRYYYVYIRNMLCVYICSYTIWYIDDTFVGNDCACV